jgi:hypothetical protein
MGYTLEKNNNGFTEYIYLTDDEVKEIANFSRRNDLESQVELYFNKIADRNDSYYNKYYSCTTHFKSKLVDFCESHEGDYDSPEKCIEDGLDVLTNELNDKFDFTWAIGSIESLKNEPEFAGIDSEAYSRSMYKYADDKDHVMFREMLLEYTLVKSCEDYGMERSTAAEKMNIDMQEIVENMSVIAERITKEYRENNPKKPSYEVDFSDDKAYSYTVVKFGKNPKIKDGSDEYLKVLYFSGHVDADDFT